MDFYEQRRLCGKAYNVAFKHLGTSISCTSDSEIIAEVKRLMKQFYYGIAAQKELLNKCIELGWIKTD